MAVVRLEALRALRAAIECAIPELEGKICAGQSPVDRDRPALSLAIIVGRLGYEPDQDEPRFEPAVDKLVVNVGRHEGPVKLALTAPTLGQRYELEQRLIDLFLAGDGEGSPGVLTTPVTSCPELGEFVAAWCLDSDEWDDEKVFERRFVAEITLTATIPALVTRCGVYRITDLRLGLAEFGVPTSSTVETVRINVDGTTTPVA